jgi:hypothetical protein
MSAVLYAASGGEILVFPHGVYTLCGKFIFNRLKVLRMDNLILRIGALLAHAFLNIVLVSYLFNFDITGSWLAVTLFFVALFILLIFFIKHFISFVNYLKTKTK